MQQSARLKWVTPNAESEIVNIARVSNTNPPQNTPEGDARLISYMIKHGHVSPFEMASMCIEINAPRDITRQILRHRSFSFQEFSQRYSKVNEDMIVENREVRIKHPKNRQMSVAIEDNNSPIQNMWNDVAVRLVDDVFETYADLASMGAAPETIRAILPEGFTMSHLYMAGTVRSWIHYLKERTKVDAVQREHYLLAKQIEEIFKEQFPIIWEAMFGELSIELEYARAKQIVADYEHDFVFDSDVDEIIEHEPEVTGLKGLVQMVTKLMK